MLDLEKMENDMISDLYNEVNDDIEVLKRLSESIDILKKYSDIEKDSYLYTNCLLLLRIVSENLAKHGEWLCNRGSNICKATGRV